MRVWLRLSIVVLSSMTLTSCAAWSLLERWATAPSEPALLVPVVIESYPHDPAAFTQGLLIKGGWLYESTGLYGESSLREIELITGEVLRRVELADDYFAEGLALVDDRLIQLTWTSGVAFVYDFATFEQIDTYTYDTQGWGLCYDGESLYMSDGSSTLFRRDPQGFELIEEIPVTREGVPVANLNELECVGEYVYANVWYSDEIMQIEKRSGVVTAVIDASGLLTLEEQMALASGAVLNGIAYDAERDLFLLTGKLWPRLFAVRFEPVSG
jgi:glutaminyl-peptide cyclotransferase